MERKLAGWQIHCHDYARITKAERHIRDFVFDTLSSDMTLDELIERTKAEIDKLEHSAFLKFEVLKAKRGQIVGRPETASFAMNVRYYVGPRWVVSVNEPYDLRYTAAAPPQPKRCYVAGKISDLPEAEFVANFRTGAAEVESFGLHPVVPLNLAHDHDKAWLAYMKVDLAALLTCDYVYALRNWQDSKGATIEVNLARSLGIQILEQAAFDEAKKYSPSTFSVFQQQAPVTL